jgi:hypothetical protein
MKTPVPVFKNRRLDSERISLGIAISSQEDVFHIPAVNDLLSLTECPSKDAIVAPLMSGHGTSIRAHLWETGHRTSH